MGIGWRSADLIEEMARHMDGRIEAVETQLAPEGAVSPPVTR